MSPKTMKVVQQHTFGKPDVLHVEDAPVPALQPGEVLVRVHAVGLNPPDWYLREGYKMLPREWQPKVSFPLVLGTDISGVIEAVADDVKDFVVGDEVYSMVRFPSGIAGGSRAYAQYVNVSVTELAHKPKRVSHEMAAAAPMSLLTAWQFLIEQGHEIPNPLQPNQHEPVALEKKTVLLNGAAGGVGHSRCNWRNGRGRASSPSARVGMKHSCAIWAPMNSSTTPGRPPRKSFVTLTWWLMRWAVPPPGASCARSNAAARCIRSSRSVFLVLKKRSDWASLSLQPKCAPVARNFSSLPSCSTTGWCALPLTALLPCKTPTRHMSEQRRGISEER